MRSSLIVGCMTLVLFGTAPQAQACNGRGRGGLGIGAGLVSLGMRQMQMIAEQERYEAAQRAESHRKHVATYSSLRDRQLADREARRQARLAGQNSSSADYSTSTTSASSAAPEFSK
jgi:hypothetical protein